MAEKEIDFEVFIDVIIDEKEIEEKTQTLAEKLGKFAKGLGSMLGQTAMAIGDALGDALGAAGVAAFKVGTEWESAFAGVRKTVNATDAELDILEQGILDMAKSIPLTATELAGIAEMAGLLGIKSENILGFTRVVADLGATTDMSAEQAAASLAQLADITQMPQESFDRLGSTIVALGNNIAATESGIMDMSILMADAASQAGFSEAEIAALSASLSAVGIEAEAGGEAMTRVLNDISTAVEESGPAMQGFADIAGVSAEEFSRLWGEDAASAFDLFIQGLGDAEERGLSMAQALEEVGITSENDIQALSELAGAGSLLSEALGIANEAWGENTALAADAEQQYSTTENQIQMLNDKFTDLGIQIFENMQEPLGAALEAFNEFVDTIAESGALEDLCETVGLLGEIIAETLVDTLPIIVDLIDALLPLIMDIVEMGLSVLAELFELILPQLETLTEKLLGPLVEMTQKLLEPIMSLVSSLLPLLCDVLFILLDPILQLIDMLLPPLIELFEGLSPVIDALMPIVTTLAGLFTAKLGGAIEAVMPIILNLKDYLRGLLDFIAGVFSGDWKRAWEGIVKIFKYVFNAIPAAAEAIINLAVNVINGLIRGINAVTGVIGIPSIPEIPFVSLPRFHAGGIIEFAGGAEEGHILARRGEMVLTEAQQAEVWKILNEGGSPDTSAPAEISVQNNLEGRVYMDGRMVGQVVWENLDDVAAFQ